MEAVVYDAFGVPPELRSVPDPAPEPDAEPAPVREAHSPDSAAAASSLVPPSSGLT